MNKTKITEEQIAFVLKQVELGTKVEKVCRKIGIYDVTFYNWRKNNPGWDLPGSVGLSSLEKKTRS